MVLFDLHSQHSGIILDDSVTAETAADLTDYNDQHIGGLALAANLDTVHVRSRRPPSSAWPDQG
jgi:hypothetical protein